MKAVVFYYENTEVRRNLPESFSCYVSDELYETLQKHNEDQGCLIELENGSQIYLGSEADKAEPNKNSDFSFIKDENTLLSIVSYALALKDFIFKNFSAADLSLSNYNHPVEAYPNPEADTTFFSFPIGNGLFFENINAEDFNLKILPKITDSCYKHVEHEYMKLAFDDGKKAEDASQKKIFAAYMENIRFFTEFRQNFLNETVQDIFNDQDIFPLFTNVKIPENFSEETLHQIYFSLTDENKNQLANEHIDLSTYAIDLKGNFTFDLYKEGMEEPVNLLPNDFVEADIYVGLIEEAFSELSKEILKQVADGKLDPSLVETYDENLSIAYDDMLDLGDFMFHLENGEKPSLFASEDLRDHFIEMLEDENLDCKIFKEETVKKSRSR